MEGNRLKLLRERAGLTQEELAQKLAVSTQQIWRWETNKNDPAGEVVARIARLFDVTSDYLLGLDNLPNDRARFPDLLLPEKYLIIALRHQDFVFALDLFNHLVKAYSGAVDVMTALPQYDTERAYPRLFAPVSPAVDHAREIFQTMSRMYSDEDAT